VQHGLRDPDLKPAAIQGRQIYRIVDVRNPSKPGPAVGRWHLPGTMEERQRSVAGAPPAQIRRRLPRPQHNVYPQRPDRATSAISTGGIIAARHRDQRAAEVISRWGTLPPLQRLHPHGAALFERELLVVTDESIQDDGADCRSSCGCSTCATETQSRERRHVGSARG